jgi:hypothetical protein
MSMQNHENGGNYKFLLQKWRKKSALDFSTLLYIVW